MARRPQARAHIPSATIGWELAGETTSARLMVDTRQAAVGLEHLYQLGHRKIAFIRGPKMLIDSARAGGEYKNCAQRWFGDRFVRLVLRCPDSLDPTPVSRVGTPHGRPAGAEEKIHSGDGFRTI